MNRFLDQLKGAIKKINIRKASLKIGFFFIGVLMLILIGAVGLGFYVQQHQPAILAEINRQINENINGKVTIGAIKFKFLTGFPNATLALNQVELKDSLWTEHRQTFLKAKEIEIRLNVWNLIHNKIAIHKIVIHDASIIFYKAPNGYTNTYLLKPKKKFSETRRNASIHDIVLNRLRFIARNEKDMKLFDFDIASLKTKLDYTGNHVKTNVRFKTRVKNLIFKPKNGSFLKEQWIEGLLAVDFSVKQDLMILSATKLKIGNDQFTLKGLVNLGKYNSNFLIDLKTRILWSQMTPLLSPNIRKVLNQFDLKNPADGTCIIAGQWDIAGNPKIIIKANIINNELKTPDGTIANCHFEGEYNNHYIKGKGNNDPNSVIVLKNFKGSYKTIPFEMPIAKITDLKKPVASGKFKSDFEVKKLNELINEKLILFSSGQATINFDFKINIVDLKINKPTFTGSVLVSDAHLEYAPKKLVFQNTDIQLDFTDRSLLIKKMKYKDQTSTVYMDGKIDHFLHLYYQDSDKMIVNWNIYSPLLDVQQFLGLLTKRPKKDLQKKTKRDPFSEKLQTVFDKCQVAINLKADKIIYGTVLAEQVSTAILMDDNTLKIKNGSLKTLGGTIGFEGELIPKNSFITFNSQAQLSHLDLEQVLGSIDNFGLKSLNSKNIKGQISANASISGMLLPKGQLLRNSVSLNIKKGVINSLGGIISFDGELYPKNKMFYFDFNTQIDQINAAELLATFGNFGMKSLNTQYLNGPLSANTSISGQLLPNWRLSGNSIHFDIDNGILKSFDGTIHFQGQLIPKNKSYTFTTTAKINNIDLDQFLYTFSYFDITSLEKQKIKGEFSAETLLNGTLLSSGNLLDHSVAVELRNGLVKSLGGSIAFDGKLFPKNKMYDFSANAKVNQVDITQFLQAFDNFGISSFYPENINGRLSSTANIHGALHPSMGLVPNSITGEVKIDIKEGALVDFEPIKKVWKFIFPFRDFDNITFSSISGDLKIEGEKVNVSHFKVSSNVMNFDMEGVYSFNKGTNLALTIPIRNPKKDEKISDEMKKTEKRDNGIVLHLTAVDGPDGKIKIKWNKKKQREKN